MKWVEPSPQGLGATIRGRHAPAFARLVHVRPAPCKLGRPHPRRPSALTLPTHAAPAPPVPRWGLSGLGLTERMLGWSRAFESGPIRIVWRRWSRM